MFAIRRFTTALLLAAGASALAFTAQAGIPKGGLGAITVSNDGSTVYAAGDNRVLYVLNASDLSVKKRVWIELNPYELILSKDGKTLVLHDSSGLLTFMDAETFEPRKTIKNADKIALASEAGLIIAAAQSKGRGEKASTDYAVYEIASGKQINKGAIKASVDSISVMPDASKIFAITNAIKTDQEKKEKPPKELKDMDRATFIQNHDEKYSQVITLDDKGTEIGRYDTWAVAGGWPAMAVSKDGLRIANSSNINVKLDFDGDDVSLFKTDSFGHYGYAFSNDGSMLISGGLRKGAITNFANGETIPFALKNIGGWPEYFEGFAIGPKGNIYGGTSAYRLLKLSPQGAVQAEVPVF